MPTYQNVKHLLHGLVNKLLVFTNVVVQFFCTELHVAVCWSSDGIHMVINKDCIHYITTKHGCIGSYYFS